MLKSLLCSTLLLFAISAAVQAQEAVPLARGNTPGEPHHHLKIENEYVRVYYVEAPPHEATLLHQHDHDYIYVSLGPSDVVNAILNKPEIHLQLKDGETHFTRGGFAHVARNLADTPFRNVTIELLRPQGEPRNICEKIVEGPLGNCPQSDSDASVIALSKYVRSKRLLETDDILTESVVLAVKSVDTAAGARHARLLVACDKAELRVEPTGEPSISLHGGEALWLSPGRTVAITNLVEHGASHYLMLSFKDKEETKKP